MVSFQSGFKANQDAVIIFLTREQLKKKGQFSSQRALSQEIDKIVAAKQFDADPKQVFVFLYGKKLIALVGLGNQKDVSLTDVRVLTRQILLSMSFKQIVSVEIAPHSADDASVKAVIDGAIIGTYVWRKYKSEVKGDKPILEKKVVLAVAQNELLHKHLVMCEGVNYARDFVNDNADVVTSEYFEKAIKQIVKSNKNVKLEILNKKELKAKGLNLHLAVNQGSKKEPKLIIVKYSGGSKTQKYTALIGKGMTFDTGGLNLKPTGNIETMRLDMGGAAAVMGALKNTLALKPKKNILFVFGLAENVTGSLSYKPGDVIKSYSGKTVEVLNTDAEGRLVLADAISYVIKNYKPARIIDIATLTGACVVALGHDYTGLVTTDDEFSRQLIQASNETDDRAWRLPSYPELKSSVQSKIADISNLGTPRGAGGAITAAEFLRQFAEGTTWAHLDIAGTSFVDGDSRQYFGYGGTGAGVRLLTQYLITNN